MMIKTFQPLSQMLLSVFHLIHALDMRWDQKSKELHVIQILSMVDTLRELHLCTYRRVQVYKQTVIDTHSEQLEEDQIKEVLDSVHRTQFLLGRWMLTNRLLVEQLQEHLRYLEDYYKSFNQAYKQAKPEQITKEVKEVVQPIQTVNQVSKEVVQPIQTVNQVPKEVVQPIQTVNQVSKEIVQPIQTVNQVSKEVVQPIQTVNQVPKEVVQPIQTVNQVSKEVVQPIQTVNQVSKEVVQPIQTVNQVSSALDAVKVGGAVKKRRPSSPPFMSKDVRKPRPQTKPVKVKLPVAPLIVTHHQLDGDMMSNQNKIVSKIGSRIYYRK
ncbi:methyl-accepting chemotaxis protein [Paenibacillus sp. chi10]|uniref:Methyl-accepting chemotaxis protein n=1 Tax=Paenibacillus suaedae TaxID=3077233 RepID=A0AAJ2N3W0_9BACL|nr:methyl-accepting chemotaxis protein [Paenibacillus sp. chi10]MDT8976185.1 methyl-accepting chemotaxis protein [Paenibacillus sp. chi10]